MLWPQRFLTLGPKGDVSPEPQGPTHAAALTPQSGVKGHQYHLGTCQKCKFLGITPDLLNQTLWGGICGYEQVLQVIDAHQWTSGKMTGLKAVRPKLESKLGAYKLCDLGLLTSCL